MAAGRLVAGVLALVPAAAAAAGPWAAIRTPTAGGGEALGSPTAGCLAGGRPLALDGPGFEVVRVSRRRHFGHPSLIAYVEDLGRAARKAGLGTLVIGDLAQPRGGPIPGGHASHQSGLDADVGFDLAPRRARPAAARERVTHTSVVLPDNRHVDPARFRAEHVRLLALATEPAVVDRVFVHPAVKRALCDASPGAAWLRKVRPWYGHDAHFHVRLRCPEASAECVPAAELPEGPGCDDTLAWWFELEDGVLPARREVDPPGPRPRREAAPPPPELPARCTEILDAR